MSWTTRLRNLLRINRLDAETEEELRFHLESRIRDNIARGMSPEEARQDAARRFGGRLLAREKSRDADVVLWLDTLQRDIRYGLRNLARNRGVAIVAALSLALGIGANTAIFSAVHAVLLRPLPYRDPGRLAMLWMDNRRLGLHEDLSSYGNFLDWKKNRTFEDMAGFVPTDVTLTALEEPVRVIDAVVDANVFAVLGVSPILGRTFSQDETQPDRDAVVILSYAFWQRQFGGDRGIVGKMLELNGRRRQVIGVMPAGFWFPSKETQLWRPLALSPQDRANRGGFFLSVIGRVKPGVDMKQARAEMTNIGAQLERQYPNQNKGYGVWVVPLLDQVVGSMRQALLVLLGAVAFVLLIACANVANLLLGRGAVRSREIAVRAALGAGRGRLVRQLLTESVVLSTAAGILGLLLAFWGIRGLVMLAPKDLPRLNEISIDSTVLAFTLGVSVAAGILFGLLPALRVSAIDLNEALREGGRTSTGGKRSRFIRSSLTVAEVAFSMVLLTGAGLMVRSLISVQSINPGFRTENVLTWRILASRTKYPQPAQLAGFYSDVLQRIRAIPGVENAGAVTDIFLSITPNSGNFTVEGHPSPPPEQQIEATRDFVNATYFQTMGTPLIRGRFFDDRDRPDSPQVALINETMARRLWPNEDAVGKRFHFGGPDAKQPWITVVGIVGDMRRQGMDKLARCETFGAITQRAPRGMTLVVRTTGDPEKFGGSVRDAIRAVDKSAVLYGRSTIADEIGDSLSQRRFETLLLTLFSAIALLLAAIGIYGVVYQSVAQRVSEIGIRIALGAQRGGLLRMVVGEALTLVCIGTVIGAVCSLAVSRSLSSFLYAISAADPLTYAGVALVLAATAVLASIVPARRAAGVDPIIALRYE